MINWALAALLQCEQKYLPVKLQQENQARAVAYNLSRRGSNRYRLFSEEHLIKAIPSKILQLFCYFQDSNPTTLGEERKRYFWASMQSPQGPINAVQALILTLLKELFRENPVWVNVTAPNSREAFSSPSFHPHLFSHPLIWKKFFLSREEVSSAKWHATVFCVGRCYA